jgi:hypothetical protein
MTSGVLLQPLRILFAVYDTDSIITKMRFCFILPHFSVLVMIQCFSPKTSHTSSHATGSMEEQLVCAPLILAGVRGAGSFCAYFDVLMVAVDEGLGGDIDDAFDVSSCALVDIDDVYCGEPVDCSADAESSGGTCSLHDPLALSELSQLASAIIQSSSASCCAHNVCVLSHWPCAPAHLLQRSTSSDLSRSSSQSTAASPCYWLSLVSSILVKGEAVTYGHIEQAVCRWSQEQPSLSSSSPPSPLSICTISQHIALQIYLNVLLLNYPLSVT